MNRTEKILTAFLVVNLSFSILMSLGYISVSNRVVELEKENQWLSEALSSPKIYLGTSWKFITVCGNGETYAVVIYTNGTHYAARIGILQDGSVIWSEPFLCRADNTLQREP